MKKGLVKPVILSDRRERRISFASTIQSHTTRFFVAALLRMTFKRELESKCNCPNDPKMFGNSLAEEFSLLEGKLGFSRDEIRSLILQGIQAAWLSEDKKQRLVEAFRGDPAWEEGAPSGEETSSASED